MKSIKLLVLSLCGLFSMSSCVNDFLDRDPMDIISEDLVWSNENAVNAYMAGMYEDMFVEPHAWLINWGTLGITQTNPCVVIHGAIPTPRYWMSPACNNGNTIKYVSRMCSCKTSKPLH